MRVAIAVITFQRGRELRRLLDSIAGLRFQRTAPDVSLVIVDNDANGSARGVVAEARAFFPWPLTYEIEPKRGISTARNHAIAIAVGAEFLAFIDDDETVRPDWLEQLLLVQAENAADVVAGPVSPQFEKPPPDWIVKGGFFVKDYDRRGKANERSGGSGNLLIRKECLDGTAEPFSERFNLTGGGDYHLLLRMKAMGARISWAPLARASEYVMADRANARWILKRRFRIGSTMARAERLLRPPWGRLRPIKGLLRILQGCILLPVSWPFGKAGTVRKLGMICFGCGVLAGWCGFQYREYADRKNSRA